MANIFGGNELVDYPNVDGFRNFYMLDSKTPINGDGDITHWEIIAKNTKPVQLIIYRFNGSTYEPVGQSERMTPVVGKNRFDLSTPIAVQKGDLVGWHFPETGCIACDAPTEHERDLSLHMKYTNQQQHISAFFESQNRNTAICVSGVPAATEIFGGNELVDYPHVDGFRNFYMLDSKTPINGDGVITHWEIIANNTKPVQLIIYRFNGSTYEPVGQSERMTPAVGKNRFDLSTPIPVKEGDLVGWHFPETGCIACDAPTEHKRDLSLHMKYTNQQQHISAFFESQNRNTAICVSGHTIG